MIRALDADIIGLQEVDQHVMHREGHQLDFIAQNTGYHVVVGSTMLQAEAEYGNAVLSRLPIEKFRKYDLTVLGREPRGALEVELVFHGLRLRVINTHLGLRYSERRHQVSQLLSIIEKDKQSPAVLVGDFNEWLPLMGSTLKLRRRYPHTVKRTFPSWRPLFPLDQIFACHRPSIYRTEVISGELAMLASDHLPIKAYLSV